MTIQNRDQVYADIKSRILSLRMAPGEDIDEKKISEEFGISRTPLRDILRELAGEGYIDIVGNRGASVASMNHESLRDFYQSALGIYSMVARLAVLHASDEQIDRLKREQRIYASAASCANIDALLQSDLKFHTIIGEMAGNSYLLPSCNRLLFDQIRIARYYHSRHNADSTTYLELSSQQHEQMIEAIECNNTEIMVDLTRVHWQITRHEADMYVNAEPLPLDTEPGTQATLETP